MTTIPLTDCCAMLGIDPKTLRHWLKRATMEFVPHPTDARLKCLSLEQVHQLATLHDRPLQQPAAGQQHSWKEALCWLNQRLHLPLITYAHRCRGKLSARSLPLSRKKLS